MLIVGGAGWLEAWLAAAASARTFASFLTNIMPWPGYTGAEQK